MKKSRFTESQIVSILEEGEAGVGIAELARKHGISRACQVSRLSRTAWYRRPASSMERDRPVIELLNGMVARRPRWGFWKLYDRSRLDGERINHKRLHRVYCAMKLNLPRRTKRRLPTRIRQPLLAPDRKTYVCLTGELTPRPASSSARWTYRRAGKEKPPDVSVGGFCLGSWQ